MAKKYLPYGMAKTQYIQTKSTYSEVTASESKKVQDLKSENKELKAKLDTMREEMLELKEELRALRETMAKKKPQKQTEESKNKDPKEAKTKGQQEEKDTLAKNWPNKATSNSQQKMTYSNAISDDSSDMEDDSDDRDDPDYPAPSSSNNKKRVSNPPQKIPKIDSRKKARNTSPQASL